MSDRPLTYAVIAQDIEAILDALDIQKAVICGYSMGGSIVFEFMKMFPERILGGIPVVAFQKQLISAFGLNFPQPSHWQSGMP